MADCTVGLVIDIAALLEHTSSSRPSDDAAAEEAAEAARHKPRRKVA